MNGKVEEGMIHCMEQDSTQGVSAKGPLEGKLKNIGVFVGGVVDLLNLPIARELIYYRTSQHIKAIAIINIIV